MTTPRKNENRRTEAAETFESPLAFCLADSSHFFKLWGNRDWAGISLRVPGFAPSRVPNDLFDAWSDDDLAKILQRIPQSPQVKRCLHAYIKRAGRGPVGRFNFLLRQTRYGFEALPPNLRTVELYVGIVTGLWTADIKNTYDAKNLAQPLVRFLLNKHKTLYLALHNERKTDDVLRHFGYKSRTRRNSPKKATKRLTHVKDFLKRCETLKTTALPGGEKLPKLPSKRAQLEATFGKAKLTLLSSALIKLHGAKASLISKIAKVMANELTINDVYMVDHTELIAILQIAMLHENFSLQRFSGLIPVFRRHHRFAAVAIELGLELPDEAV